jgi:hypothetical protein
VGGYDKKLLVKVFGEAGLLRDFRDLWRSHACRVTPTLIQRIHPSLHPKVGLVCEKFLYYYYSDYLHLLYKICLYIMNSLGSRSTAVVVDTSRSSVIAVAIVVEVDLIDSLLQYVHNGVERTKTVLVNRAARVRV